MSNRATQLKIFLIANLFLILAINFIQMEAIFLLALIMVFYVLIFTFINQKIALLLIVLFRPCLDIFTSEQAISFTKIPFSITSVIGLISVVLAAILILKNKAQRPPLFTAWIIFLSIGLLSLLFSLDKIISLKEIIRLSSIFLIYLSTFYLIKKNKDFVLLVKVIIFSALIPGSLALYQYFTNTGLSVPMENIYNRIYGTFAHPNLFAYYLIIPITLAILIFLIGKKEKIVNILILSLSLFFILLLGLTFTRGAWLAFMLIVLIIGIMQYRILLVSALVIFSLSYLVIPPIHSRINDLRHAKKGNSIEWRQNLWRDSLGYIKDKPVIGHGVGTANKVILEKRGERMGSSDPHNDYLKITIEDGLLGLISYLALIFTTLTYLIKNYFKSEKIKIKTVNLTIFSLFLSLMIMSFADNIIRNTALQWALWSLIGGLMGLNYFKNTENRVEKIIDKQ